MSQDACNASCWYILNDRQSASGGGHMKAQRSLKSAQWHVWTHALICAWAGGLMDWLQPVLEQTCDN
eukprot:6214805-Pleurochrysis_carterae.AAC.10